MSSEEGQDAVGEAPRRPSIAEQLEAKRSELVAANDALARAHRGMNTDGVVREQQRIRVIQGFIATLEVDAELERERVARQQAKQRALGIRRALGSLMSELDEDEKRVRDEFSKL